MDPVERLIVEESPEQAHHILVIDCPGLVEAAQERAATVSVWCDDREDADKIPEELLLPSLKDPKLADVDLVWLRLPKALAALDEYAEQIAAHTSPDVHVVAGGRVKQMTLAQNDVLGKHFSEFSASLGRYKSRALHAAIAKPRELTWPRERLHPDLGIGVIAHGATFATNKVDDGTRLLATRCPNLHGADILDFGCGSGILATLLARANRDSTVNAVDTSWAAVDSARETAEANGQNVQTHWAYKLDDWADNTLDLIVLNPPFHKGVAKDSEPAIAMFEAAGRLLRPGGELWCVFNSHLPWKGRMSVAVGQTTVEYQNPFFTVTRSAAR